MSAEDLEIHQPADPLKGSGMYSILHGGNGILRGRSLPSLLEVLSHPNEEGDDYSPEDDINATNHKEQERAFIQVAVERN